MSSTLIAPDLDTSYSLSDERIQFFREKGYVTLKEVFSASTLSWYGREITEQVKALNVNNQPMEQRSTYQKAFLQIINLWQHSALVKEFVFGKRLARIAAELLGTRGTRLYHDQALYKEAGGGITPWHADQFYWPLATPLSVTAWIPLQATPLEMGPLSFAAQSHHFRMGRDLGISDDSERQLAQMLRERNFDTVQEPFDLGEVSFHYGWTFHRAGVNSSSKPREVMTIIYMDIDMKMGEHANKSQQADADNFCPGVRSGEVIASPLNPVLYEAQA